MTEEKQEKIEEDQVPDQQVPKSLKIVVHIFFWGGILSIISMIARSICFLAGFNYVMVNFSLAGVFGIWISDGLAQYRKKWRTDAMAFLWIGVVACPLALFTLIGVSIFSDGVEIKGTFGILEMILIVSLAVLFYVVLGGWQLYVLYRKDVKSLFSKYTKRRPLSKSPEEGGLPAERYKPKSVQLPFRKYKLLLQGFAIFIILCFIGFAMITPQPGSSSNWKGVPRIDSSTAGEIEYGPFFAYGMFYISDKEEIPAFIVYSKFEVKARMKTGESSWTSLNYGGWGSTAVKAKIEFKGKEIDIPVKKPPENTWKLHEPSEPNVFLLKEDGTLERQPFIVRTIEQYDKIVSDVIHNKRCLDYEEKIKEIAEPVK